MVSLRLDNVPEELVKRLELAASSRHHGLAEEVVERLDDSFGVPRISKRRSPQELSQLAQQVRGEVAGDWLTPEFIRMAREYGRE